MCVSVSAQSQEWLWSDTLVLYDISYGLLAFLNDGTYCSLLDSYWNLASHHFWRICSLFVWTNLILHNPHCLLTPPFLSSADSLLLSIFHTSCHLPRLLTRLIHSPVSHHPSVRLSGVPCSSCRVPPGPSILLLNPRPYAHTSTHKRVHPHTHILVIHTFLKAKPCACMQTRVVWMQEQALLTWTHTHIGKPEAPSDPSLHLGVNQANETSRFGSKPEIMSNKVSGLRRRAGSSLSLSSAQEYQHCWCRLSVCRWQHLDPKEEIYSECIRLMDVMEILCVRFGCWFYKHTIRMKCARIRI